MRGSNETLLEKIFFIEKKLKIKKKNKLKNVIRKYYRQFSRFKHHYNPLQPHHLDKFKQILNPKNIITDDLDKYNTDWMNSYHGNSSLVLCPENTNELSKVLQYCNHHKLPIVTQSGNTSLVSGATPFHNEIIIQMKHFNKIISFNEYWYINK